MRCSPGTARRRAARCGASGGSSRTGASARPRCSTRSRRRPSRWWRWSSAHTPTRRASCGATRRARCSPISSSSRPRAARCVKENSGGGPRGEGPARSPPGVSPRSRCAARARVRRVNPAYLVAALSSVLYGSADFAGGLAARRAPALLVSWFSAFAALAALIVALPFTHGAPSGADWAWGAAAGAAGAAGASLIYYVLALGPVSVASPIFCVVGLSVPVVVGVLLGERPSVLAWTGVALAVLSIPALSWTGSDQAPHARARVRRTVLVSIGTGLVVGWFLVFVARISSGAGLMPLVLARGVAIVVLTPVALAVRLPLRPPAGASLVAAATG